MAKYRKLPVVVKAVAWLGFESGPHDLGIVPLRPGSDKGWMGTLEGGHEVTPGDFIITGVVGERYPCAPGVFELTYEPVE